MLKNYFKIALRNLVKNKLTSFINIMSLSIGIACCVLIFLFIRQELSYDTFHDRRDSIYGIYTTRERSDGIRTATHVPMPMGPTLQAELPEIKETVRFQASTTVIRTERDVIREEVLFTDPAFFDVFTFPLVTAANDENPLGNNGIVLTPEMATKYFGDESPIGQRISLSLGEDDLDFVVTAVASSPPANSSINFDFIVAFTTLSQLSSGAKERAQSWNSHNTHTFILLDRRMSRQELEAKLPAFAEKYFDPPQDIHLQPLTAVHLGSNIGAGWLEPTSDPLYSYILGGIACIVLMIACINFMTLTIGQSAGRTREVGMRKVMGAQRFHLVRQLWGEAVFMSLIALGAGLTLAEVFLPTFNALTGKQLALNLLSDPLVPVALLVVSLVAGSLAGAYPALLLSGFHPIEVFRRRLKLGASASFGRIMVILQFGLSIFLIITTLVMQRQQQFLMNKNLGYHRDQIVVIPTIKAAQGEELMERLRNALQAESAIQMVSGTAFSFDRGYHHVGFGYKEEYKEAYEYRVDYDYLNLMQIQLQKGRDFSRQFQTDPDRAAIVNEAFVAMMGWQEPLGQSLEFRSRDLTIIGVVKNYHFQSLHNKIEPVILHLDPATPVRHLLVKVAGDKMAAGIEVLGKTWQQLVPDLPFEYYFLDDDVARQYEAEKRWEQIVSYSCVFAVVIACLGLFGLSSLSVAQRTKEIGIRKVLGASVTNLANVINRQFLSLVILGNLLAWPVAFFALQKWLENFAYRIDLSASSFLFAGVGALVIAYLTVSFQSLKAAFMNPVDTLRYE